MKRPAATARINNEEFKVGDPVDYSGKHTENLMRTACRVAALVPSGERIILEDANGSWFPAFPGEVKAYPKPSRGVLR